MRRIIAVPMLLLLLLCACGAEKTSAQTPVQFRTSLRASQGCSYEAQITGDYGDYVRQFTLSCINQEDETSLTVKQPEYAAGITATVSGSGATVCYDDTVLAVEDFEQQSISPMASPWILQQAWEEGYISTTAMDGEQEQVTYLLGYGSDQLTVTTNFARQVPTSATISHEGRGLVTCQITDFSLNN